VTANGFRPIRGERLQQQNASVSDRGKVASNNNTTKARNGTNVGFTKSQKLRGGGNGHVRKTKKRWTPTEG